MKTIASMKFTVSKLGWKIREIESFKKTSEIHCQNQGVMQNNAEVCDAISYHAVGLNFTLTILILLILFLLKQEIAKRWAVFSSEYFLFLNRCNVYLNSNLEIPSIHTWS